MKEDLVGTIIKLNSINYLIDRVVEITHEPEKNSCSANRLNLVLIETKSLVKKIELYKKSEIHNTEKSLNVTGIRIELTTNAYTSNKISLIKSIKEIFTISLKEAKDLVDNAKEKTIVDKQGEKTIVIEYPCFKERTKCDYYRMKICLATYHHDIIQELHCNFDDISISIY